MTNRGNDAAGVSWCRLLCLAVVVVCGLAGQTMKEGDLSIIVHCAVDLDAGACECVVTLDGDGTEPQGHPSGRKFDLRLEPSGAQLFLVPKNGAGLSRWSEGCSAGSISKKRLRIDGLRKGEMRCIHTNQGRRVVLTFQEEVKQRADRIRVRYSAQAY